MFHNCPQVRPAWVNRTKAVHSCHIRRRTRAVCLYHTVLHPLLRIRLTCLPQCPLHITRTLLYRIRLKVPFSLSISNQTFSPIFLCIARHANFTYIYLTIFQGRNTSSTKDNRKRRTVALRLCLVMVDKVRHRPVKIRGNKLPKTRRIVTISIGSLLCNTRMFKNDKSVNVTRLNNFAVPRKYATKLYNSAGLYYIYFFVQKFPETCKFLGNTEIVIDSRLAIDRAVENYFCCGMILTI